MNPQDPLAQLQPLRAPTDIGWWPLAPGWWLLLALLLLALTGLAWYLWRRWQAGAYRRLALARLQALSTEHPAFTQQVNELLKGVALCSYDRQQVAGLSGAAWIAFLNGSSAPGTAKFPEDFASSPYRPGGDRARGKQVAEAAAAWIRGHGGHP